MTVSADFHIPYISREQGVHLYASHSTDRIQDRRKTLTITHGWHWLVLFCVLGTPISAQNRQESPKKKAPLHLQQELKQLDANYQKEQAAFHEPLDKAKTDEERINIYKQLDISTPPSVKYLLRYQSLEKRARGTKIGLQALNRCLQCFLDGSSISNIKTSEEIILLLTTTYLRFPELLKTTPLYGLGLNVGRRRVREVLATIARKSPNRNVRAEAIFLEAAMLSMAKSEKDGLPETRAELERLRRQNGYPKFIKLIEISITNTEQNQVRDIELQTMFERLKQNYGGTDAAKKADKYLFALEHLAIGKNAPDFQATDQDGKRFKLSDYRGKVVVIDFWGFW